MESMTFLTVAVALICAIQVVDRVAKVFAKGKEKSAPAATTRNAWYCFFRMSSLLGPDWKPFEQREIERKTARDTRREEKRRQQAGRPRMYA